MLTRDLLRTHSNGAGIKPSFVDPTDPALLHPANCILQIYAAGIGETRETLESLITPYLNLQKDLKLTRGIHKVILERCRFSAVESADFQAMRREIFRKSAALILSGNAPESAAAIREKVFSGTPGENAGGLYADLPENEKLLSVEKLFAKEVLERYNLSLVQALLLHADSLDLEICDEDPAKLRRLFKYLRFFRLLATAALKKKTDESLLKIHLDGPGSLFENVQKYGLQLASFFPAVCQLSHWKLSCELNLHEKKRKLKLDQDSGLKSHFTNFSAYVPEEFKLFADYFRKQNPAWSLNETPGFLRIGAQNLVFPDFEFASYTGKITLPLELFHRWHAAQLEERLRYCESTPAFHLLIGVDRALLKKDGVLKSRLESSPYFQDHGFLFRDFPGVENVSDLLARF